MAVNNKTLTHIIQQGGKTPNAVSNQTANANATKNGNSIRGIMDELPIKQLAVGVIAKKTVTSLVQRTGMYTGDQVLQRQINNTVSVVQGVGGIVLAGIVNPVLAGGMVASQAISYGFELSDYQYNLSRTNEQMRQEQINYNTSLNHNRYNGGTR